MKPLTKEQRAAKFANNVKNAPGLRSRGHRKLSLSEQKALFDLLEDQLPQQRLETLRILREAIRSSKDPDKDLEKTIYERSAKEYIEAQEFASVVHILGHLCTLKDVTSYWNKLYVIALTNAKRFENALQHCCDITDDQYVSSVLNMDVPLWSVLTRAQTDTTCRTLMNQLRSEIESYKRRLDVVYQHPSKARTAKLSSQKQAV